MVSLKKIRRGSGVDRLRNEMGDVLGRFMSEWDLPPGSGKHWPSIDVADKGDNILVSVEIPGCDPEDIEVSVEGDTLTIRGEKKESSETKAEDYYHMESFRGNFRRDLVLPSDVNADKSVATCKDGILQINLPKAETSKKKSIKVQT
jgi:HSP20 family protein